MTEATTSTPRHGGDRIAEALQVHGVQRLFTLCGGHISPILSAAKARGIRVVDVRDEVTAVFAADATARLTGVPGVAAVTAGPGITNTITALKNAQLAQSPVLLLGGAAPTALQGRGALQDIDQRPLVEPHVKRFFKLRRVRDLGPTVADAFALARSGVPGPVFIECPVDLLYDEASIRQWYAEAAGKGSSLSERALRWYLNRHAQRMFAGSDETVVPSVQTVYLPRATDTATRAATVALTKAERPLMVIGSQAVVRAESAAALALAVVATRCAGVPVGHGTRAARARPSAADAPSTPAGAARGGLRAARRRAVRLPARLRPPRAAQCHADRGQPQRERCPHEPPARRGGHRRRGAVHRIAGGRIVSGYTLVGLARRRCVRATRRARPRSTSRRQRAANT